MAELHAPAGGEIRATVAERPNLYAWVVFALSFGLLLSDYMSRQVLNAVFPLLKHDWGLKDVQLGSLSSVVSLMVGLLTVPLSLVAERVGRVKSLAAMAVLWSLATLACGLAQDYHQMLLARFFVGLGEAAYGSVGIAVVLSVFPASMRATLAGAFMAGGMAGSVLGVALGGVLAVHFGWRMAFVAMAGFGLVLAFVYPLVVRDAAAARPRTQVEAGNAKRWARIKGLVGSRTVLSAYIGSGLQLFICGAVLAWMPSYLNRYHGLAPDRAGVSAAVLALISGAGMVFWGMVSDRLSKRVKPPQATLALVLCLSSCLLLAAAFRLPPGQQQLVLVAAGLFAAAGATGPSGAMVANLTHPAVHGAAFAVLTFANNLLGLAPGPVLTGALADRVGLDVAFQWIPLVSLGAAVAFLIGRFSYPKDLARQHPA